MKQNRDNSFDSIASAISAIVAGKPIIVTDDEHRENEGDLIMAAQTATVENVNFMIRHCRGLICVPATASHLDQLGISLMVQKNRESQRTAFTVSVDAAEGISTGISAHDRWKTIRILADLTASADQLVQPGHVFPLEARPGGVLERAGHTEAAIDLATMAGYPPVAVVCEILNEDGSCARLPELLEFKNRHGLNIISIADLIEYRHRRDQLVEVIGKSKKIMTQHGEFDLHTFRNRLDNRIHFALSRGKLDKSPILVRVHGECLKSDVFGEITFGKNNILNCGLEAISRGSKGVFVYMTKPYRGMDVDLPVTDACGYVSPSSMTFRDYGIGAQILASLGLKKIRVITSSKRVPVALEGYGLEIVEQIDP